MPDNNTISELRDKSRGRSLAAIQLEEARLRSGLTHDDMSERYHAWWHAYWMVNPWMVPAFDVDHLHRCSVAHCRNHRAQGPRISRRLERLTQATHDRNPRKWADELATFTFLAEVAHAEADIEDVFEACYVEAGRLRRAKLKRQADERMRLARDLAEHVRMGRIEELSPGDHIEALALRLLAADRAVAA